MHGIIIVHENHLGNYHKHTGNILWVFIGKELIQFWETYIDHAGSRVTQYFVHIIIHV